jgi:pilus assembly protein CpaC
MSLRQKLAALSLALLPCLVTAAFALPAGAKEVTASQGSAIQIELNKGQLIRLEHAAATVFVANPEIADIQVKSPTLIYVFAKKVGETTLFAVDEHERTLLDAPVTVSHDLTRLNGALKSLLPDSDIAARSVDGGVVLSGAVDSAVQAEDARRMSARFIGKDEEVINRLNVTGPNQVNLRVRVAEVSRNVTKQLGINWESVFSTAGFVFGLGVGAPFIAGVGALGAVPRSTDSTLNNAFFHGNSGDFDLNALIDALADENLITVLAEPNLIALSGETASFLAGGEFPVPVPQSGTSNNITIEFKKFGVSLAFTPTVLDSGRIGLKVIPEVSELATNTANGAVEIDSFTIPALTTRRAETTVELGSGQSFAIAGLLQNNISHDVSKFPGLGDLPVIGTLFRSSRFLRNESELVIIVTPYIVRPVSSMRMASPTDGLVAPSDRERIFLGRSYSPQLKQQPKPGPVGPGGEGLNGSVGFMMDQ